MIRGICANTPPIFMRFLVRVGRRRVRGRVRPEKTRTQLLRQNTIALTARCAQRSDVRTNALTRLPDQRRCASARTARTNPGLICASMMTTETASVPRGDVPERASGRGTGDKPRTWKEIPCTARVERLQVERKQDRAAGSADQGHHPASVSTRIAQDRGGRPQDAYSAAICERRAVEREQHHTEYRCGNRIDAAWRGGRTEERTNGTANRHGKRRSQRGNRNSAPELGPVSLAIHSASASKAMSASHGRRCRRHRDPPMSIGPRENERASSALGATSVAARGGCCTRRSQYALFHQRLISNV
jgi:hypothetical protein